MSLTSLARMFFRGRLHELESYPTRGEQMQREVLQFLVDCAKGQSLAENISSII